MAEVMRSSAYTCLTVTSAEHEVRLHSWARAYNVTITIGLLKTGFLKTRLQVAASGEEADVEKFFEVIAKHLVRESVQASEA